MPTDSFILIVDDHPLYKHALANLLKVTFPEKKIYTAVSGEDALTIIEKVEANSDLEESLVIVDLTLPGISGMKLLDALRTQFTKLRTAVISGSDEILRVGACFDLGAFAYICKNAAPDAIVDLISKNLKSKEGKRIFLNMAGEISNENIPKTNLTVRQCEVLHLVCEGYTNKQIADQLKTVEATVKAHVSSIMNALRVENRTQAVLLAQKLGISDKDFLLHFGEAPTTETK
jgi:DNA-binding NarL/FixJ family response regulator